MPKDERAKKVRLPWWEHPLKIRQTVISMLRDDAVLAVSAKHGEPDRELFAALRAAIDVLR